jgi:CDP-diglyceride synthetase
VSIATNDAPSSAAQSDASAMSPSIHSFTAPVTVRPLPPSACAIIAVYALGTSPLLRLILAFVEVAFHRRSPADFPASRAFFIAVLLVYVGVELATTRYLQVERYPELEVAFDTVLGLAFMWSVLHAFQRERRFRQAAVAMLGADTFLNLLTVPLLSWHASLHAKPEEATLPYVLFLLVVIWSVDVSAFILSRALERPYVLAVAIMVGYVLLEVSAHVTLFSPAT